MSIFGRRPNLEEIATQLIEGFVGGREVVVKASAIFAFWFCPGCGQPTANATKLEATDVFRDGDLSISVKKVGDSGVVANTSVLVLEVENRSPGKIYYLPLWDERQESARITDEHGNVFYPNGRRYCRNPRGAGGPQPNGNRVDPGANDVLVIEFVPIPENSKKFKVELPYQGRTLAFTGIPHTP